MSEIENTTYEIHKYNSNKWNEILSLFEDASIYQTASFTKYSIGGNDSETFIVKNNNNIIAAAQVRIKVIPFLNRGIAYIRYGPMWRRKNEYLDLYVFNNVLKHLYTEYVVNRKLLLKIIPNILPQGSNKYHAILTTEDYKKDDNDTANNTMLLELSKSEEDLRKGLKKKWRHYLNRAEKKEFRITNSTELEDFEIFISLYQSMHESKKFDKTVSVNNFKQIQEELADDLKMRIFICYYDNQPISSLIGSAIGETGIGIFAATNKLGRDLGCSYLLHWERIKWMKSVGCKYFDLGGVDKVNNPGVYHFKSGLNADEAEYIGEYVASNNNFSKLLYKFSKIIK